MVFSLSGDGRWLRSFSDAPGGAWKAALTRAKDRGFGSWPSESGDDVTAVAKSGGLKVRGP